MPAPSAKQYPDIRIVSPVTILNTEAISTAINLYGTTVLGFYMPAAWTAADITFESSFNGSDFVEMRDISGNVITATVGVDRFVSVDPDDFAGVQHVKLVSSMAQGADRIITVISKAK